MESLQAARLTLAACLAVISCCQGLEVTVDRTPSSHYCARLQCKTNANTLKTNNIFAITELTIYDVTQTNNRGKLASVSVYDPDVVLEETEGRVRNVTGTVSKDHAELTLYFVTDLDCLYGSFLCELDFVNTSGHPDVVTQTVAPGVTANNVSILNMFAKLTSQIKQVEIKVDSLDKKLNTVIQVLSSEKQKTCVKGLPYKNPREVFLLWDTIPALCDTQTDGGGWVIIQRRATGDVDFFRGWNGYKKGFGCPDTDFWIGNDVIHNLTSNGYSELRVDMKTINGSFYAHYKDFRVADETSKYQLSVSGYTGNKTDGLLIHDGMYFSTFDRDNDNSSINCAATYHAAWWYNACFYSSMNGMLGTHNNSGVLWGRGGEFKIENSLNFAEIKVRKF